jgi:carboxylesterase type B
MATAMVDYSYNSSTIYKLVFAAGSQLHGATAAFLTSNTTDFPQANNQTIAKIMSDYWISFALTGDPNTLRAPNAPIWPSYMSGGDGTIASGEGVGFSSLSITYSSINTVKDPDASAQCDFFSSRGYTLRN